jgi:hypothetical protein
MAGLDVFNGDGFTVRSLTTKVNKVPFVPGRLGALGIFRPMGISTLVTMIEEKNGVLYLVKDQPRGGEATQNRAQGRKLIPLANRHLPVEDKLMADEVQGVRAFGSESEVETIQGKTDEKLTTMRQSVEATLEYHRVGAVKGIVLDSDGSTLYNLFTTFNISQRTDVHFNFTDATEFSKEIMHQLNDIARDMEDDLGGTPHQGMYGICGRTFMDSLTGNAETIKAYDRWQEGQALRESYARRTFMYGPCMFEEYRGKVGSVSYIDDDECRFFPIGVPDLFETTFAPANWIETVNTPGLPVYAKVTPDNKGRWVDIDVQSNPLVYCTRPRVLVRGNVGS